MFIDLPPPTNVKATVLTPHSVEVTWDQMFGATDYALSYTTSGIDKSVIVRNTSHTLTNLKENTLYTITVEASTNDIRMNGQSVVSVITQAAGKYITTYLGTYIICIIRQVYLLVH